MNSMKLTPNPTFWTMADWSLLLENLFGVSLAEKMDSIDIAWDGLEAAITSLPIRSAEVLIDRYVNRLTYKECGKKLGNVSPCRAIQIHSKALSQLRHKTRMNIFRSCISGYWNLKMDLCLTLDKCG